jgi:hypothetical protein
MDTVYVKKVLTDEKIKQMNNKFLDRSHIHTIYNNDVDIFTEDGRLLVMFRKNSLDKTKLDRFFDATYDFTRREVSGNRGNACGSRRRNVYENPRVNSAILGYFDRWGPKEKLQFRKAGVAQPLEVRETRFSAVYPVEFKKSMPLIRQISALYRRLLPTYFKAQNRKATETPFTIANTAFTTVTTNVNFCTAIHKDKGDDEDGFGNLAVIERGKYTGGEICLPQYAVGIDAREGDIVFMDVHEWHGNLPIIAVDKNAIRMSIVCYLRTNIWKRTRGKGDHFKLRHLKTIKKIKEYAKTRRKTKRK